MSTTTLIVNLHILLQLNTYTNNIRDKIENLLDQFELIKVRVNKKVRFKMRHSHTGQYATSTGQSVTRTRYDYHSST